MTEVPIGGSSTSVATVGSVDTTYPPYRGMQFEESEALKLALSWLRVPDARGRLLPIKVWFRNPEREDREVTYPHIIIDFLSMRERTEESHRGIVPFYYEPNTGNLMDLGDQGAMAEFPIPISLRYQVAVAARNNQHDVMINDILLTSVLPYRYGQLTMASGTVRRLDVLSAMRDASSLDGDQKRIFRKIWTIEISSEIVPNYGLSSLVQSVELDVTYDGETETSITTEASEV